jgi:hypothetical protein
MLIETSVGNIMKGLKINPTIPITDEDTIMIVFSRSQDKHLEAFMNTHEMAGFKVLFQSDAAMNKAHYNEMLNINTLVIFEKA